MVSFENYIFETFASEIASWQEQLVRDIYALGFLIHFEDQDLRRGTVGLVYNTHQKYYNSVRSVLERYPKIAEAPDKTEAACVEVKWHFDYWEQHGSWVGGELALVAKGNAPHADPKGASLRRVWLDSLHLWYTDEEEEADFDKTLVTGGRIEASFGTVCIAVARRMHEKGTIEEKFGRSIPIVFHNYWYDAEAAELTHDANPGGLSEEFERYVLEVRHS